MSTRTSKVDFGFVLFCFFGMKHPIITVLEQALLHEAFSRLKLTFKFWVRFRLNQQP